MTDRIPDAGNQPLLPVTGEPPNCILDPDGEHVWWFHDCDHGAKTTPGEHVRPARGSVMLPLGGEHGWTLVSADPLTVSPSIFCVPPHGCGTHGFFRDGAWVPA